MANTVTLKNHRCIDCKLTCIDNLDCVSCFKCSAWYHVTCANLPKYALHAYKNKTEKFKCNLCSTKTNCHFCEKKYPRGQRVHCLNCSHSFCSKCVSLQSGKNISSFLSSENEFYCSECDKNFLCIKCEKPCEDSQDAEPSIFCDCCKRWLHFKCSRLKVQQFNKLGRNSDPYYCSSCIGNTLPFVNISKKVFLKTIKGSIKLSHLPIVNYVLNVILIATRVAHALTSIECVTNVLNVLY